MGNCLRKCFGYYDKRYRIANMCLNLVENMHDKMSNHFGICQGFCLEVWLWISLELHDQRYFFKLMPYVVSIDFWQYKVTEVEVDPFNMLKAGITHLCHSCSWHVRVKTRNTSMYNIAPWHVCVLSWFTMMSVIRNWILWNTLLNNSKGKLLKSSVNL